MTERSASRPGRTDGPPASSADEQAPHHRAQHEQVQHDHAVLVALLTFARGLPAEG